MTPTDRGLNQVIARTSDFRLAIEDDKVTDLGLWTQVGGLDVSWASVEHRAGDSTDLWICAGRAKYQHLNLVRPVCASSAKVQAWLKNTSRDTKPSPAAVTLVDWSGTEIIKWEIRACFPLSWKISAFETAGTKPVYETLQLAHTGFLNDHMDFRKSASRA
jgi:phage tail-like protein